MHTHADTLANTRTIIHTFHVKDVLLCWFTCHAWDKIKPLWNYVIKQIYVILTNFQSETEDFGNGCCKPKFAGRELPVNVFYGPMIVVLEHV